MTGQQLKNSILQMAVQGKLVPQNPDDEPASVLIERICKEKEKLIQEGKIKKEKNQSVIFRNSDTLPYNFCEKIGNEIRDISDEIPFDIPDSWEWCRFGTATVNRDSERIPLSVAEREKLDKIYDYYGASGVIDKVDRFLFNKPLLLIGEDGANLLLRSKPIAFIAKGEYWVNNHAHVLGTIGGLCMEYICAYINSINLSPYVTGTAQPKMNQEKMNSILVPIPPTKEQHRIVAKIEELTPYIEKYEQAEKQLTKLNETFPEMLKKSIFQQAVQGKLVPQNPNDEPASILLERIRAEKQSLIKAGKIKKDKHESVIITRDKIPYEIIDGKERCIADEVPFDIPDSWCWCRLGDILIKLTDGTHSTPKYTESGVPFISVKDISSGKLDFSNCKYISETEHNALYERCNPEIGDMLLTKVGTTGIPVIVDTDKQFSLFVSVALLKFNQELLYNKYLLYMINSPLVQKQATENTKGVGNKNWVMRDIANTLIVIPPIEEQKRIVAKIEEIIPIINTISK